MRHSLTSRREPTARPDRRGSTLVQVVMAMAMVGVLTAMAVPRVSLGKYRADAGVQVVRTMLQIAQRTAVQKQFDVIVSFDVARNQIRVLEDRDNSGSAGADERVIVRTLADGARFLRPPVPAPGGAGGAAVAGPRLKQVGGLPSVIVHRNGALSTDVEVYIGAGQGEREHFRAVTAVMATARTTWYRLGGSGWMEAGI
jgi:type II secretory pathway pseudopilin PulG